MDNEKYLKRNIQIARKRGIKWKKNLTKGKLEAMVKPSIMRIRRVELGYNQADLAKSLGLSIAAFGGIERGKRGVSLKRAEILSGLLKVNKRNIFDFSGKKYFVKFVKPL